MQKRTREIIALIMLVVLGIAGIGAVTWYMLVGHNWNEAASNIDEHVGDMKGYTVILYEGIVPPQSSQYQVSISQPMLDDQNRGILETSPEQEPPEEPLSLNDAVESYREKGANVITLQVGDLKRYEDPIIVSRNGERIALYSATGPRPDFSSRNTIKQLGGYDIDFTVCIIDSLSAMANNIGDVNIAVCTDFADAGKGGRYVGRTYAVGSPYEGRVEAIVIAPSGFISTKTLTSV